MNNLNPVTLAALLSWPLVALYLYKTRSVTRATLWTILGGYMLLPVGADIKFKMIPDFDKSSIPTLAALLGCILVRVRSVKIFNGIGLAELLIVTLLISPFITNELNGDPILIGQGGFLPGLGIYDAGSAFITQAIILIPFFLGRQFFPDGGDTEEVLRVLVIAGVIYSFPALFEIRFSPQLHTWIYGYFPHMFAEQMRDGGFRPVVFLGHGLLVSFFFSTTAIAAAAFWRTKTHLMRMVRLPANVITGYLILVLFLCKTASSAIYGVIITPLVRFVGPKTQLSIAVLLVSVAVFYPLLRSADLIPTRMALDLARSISAERAGSLQTRFTNEDELLERASQRFLFGWGRYGRAFIYNQQGQETSVTDGWWVITLGEFGIVGFLAQFGLLALPVVTAARALRFAKSAKDKVFLSALALILAINLFDLLPNSSIRPWTWLIAGALLGRAEALLRWSRVPAAEMAPYDAPKYQRSRLT